MAFSTSNMWSFLLLIFFSISSLARAEEGKVTPGAEGPIVKAKVRSCGGCRLNRLPEVRSFIYDDLAYYHNVEFSMVPGAAPTMELLNAKGETVEFVDMEPHSREKLNEFLAAHDFKKNELSQGFGSKLPDLHGDDDGLNEGDMEEGLEEDSHSEDEGDHDEL